MLPHVRILFDDMCSFWGFATERSQIISNNDSDNNRLSNTLVEMEFFRNDSRIV